MNETKIHRIGDPDPTPNSFAANMKCPNRIENPDHPKSYYECTWWDDKHDPRQHVAGGMDGKIVFVWDVT